MQQQEPENQWLSLNEDAKEDRAEAERQFAQLYYDLFVANPIGAKMLAHWDETIMRRPTPVNAPLQTYVWNEAQRALIQGFKGQILLAQQQRKAK